MTKKLLLLLVMIIGSAVNISAATKTIDSVDKAIEILRQNPEEIFPPAHFLDQAGEASVGPLIKIVNEYYSGGKVVKRVATYAAVVLNNIGDPSINPLIKNYRTFGKGLDNENCYQIVLESMGVDLDKLDLWYALTQKIPTHDIMPVGRIINNHISPSKYYYILWENCEGSESLGKPRIGDTIVLLHDRIVPNKKNSLERVKVKFINVDNPKLRAHQGWVYPSIVSFKFDKNKKYIYSGERYLDNTKIDKKYDIARQIDSSAAYEYFLRQYGGSPAKEKAIERIIAVCRKKGRLDDYIKAFQYSQDKNDIKKAYQLAQNTEEKTRAEAGLVKGLDHASVFRFDLIDNNNPGKSKAVFQDANVFNIGASSIARKNIIKEFRLASKIPLEYGQYDVKVVFHLNLKYKANNLLYSSDLNVQKHCLAKYRIDRSNKYKDTQKIQFKEILTSAKSSAFGIKAGGAELKDAQISYEILEIKPVL